MAVLESIFYIFYLILSVALVLLAVFTKVKAAPPTHPYCSSLDAWWYGAYCSYAVANSAAIVAFSCLILDPSFRLSD